MNILTEEEINSIRSNPNSEDWAMLSYHYKLTESFMREFNKFLHWDFICEKQNLSESFIEEHANNENWFYISRYQSLSIDFIEKYKKHINFVGLKVNKKLPFSTFKHFEHELMSERIKLFLK